MKNMKWLLLLSGIILLGVGVRILFTPLASLVGIAFMISISMLISGLSEIAMHISLPKAFRSGWMLMGGILSAVLGFWLLFGNGALLDLAMLLPFIFATWILAKGIIRTVGSFSLRTLGSRNWGWVLVFGLLGILLGFCLMYAPAFSGAIISVIIATIFITEGATDIIVFFNKSE